MRIEANLELAKEVKTNSRGFQPSKLDDSKEKNSEAGLREDGFKVGTDTFQKWDDFVPQCWIWTMALNLDGRKLALWEWIWKDRNDAFWGRSKI